MLIAPDVQAASFNLDAYWTAIGQPIQVFDYQTKRHFLARRRKLFDSEGIIVLFSERRKPTPGWQLIPDRGASWRLESVGIPYRQKFERPAKGREARQIFRFACQHLLGEQEIV